jgi:lantibiotic transport system ATP-binding protein
MGKSVTFVILSLHGKGKSMTHSETDSAPFTIQTDQLNFSYGSRLILKDINLRVPRGSIFGFLGPNGAGKSTTIKTLLGLLRTETGMVTVFGKALNSHRIEILSRTGAMVESPSLYDHLNAIRNLEITARLRNVPFSRIGDVLETVSLTPDAHRAVKQYSTGMKQRLSLAIALLASPELLILDEPINGLDPNGIMEIRLLLSKINREQNCTILLSSHILSEIEKLCTHAAIIRSGSLLFQGTMEGLLNAATGTQEMRIGTPNALRALELIDGRFPARIQDQSIMVRVNGHDSAARLIRLLVENGIDIYSAENENSGLEASFLHMLNEKQEA